MPAADGTLRGRFELDTDPAVRSIRAYRREATLGTADTRALGESIDSAFGASEVERIHAVRDSVKDYASTTRDAHATVADSWSGMRRDIERESAAMVAAIDTVHERVRALGRERAAAHVEVNGIDRALAQVELLHSRIQALGRERATARVGVGGGMLPGGGGGGFGGGGGRGFAYTGTGGSGIGAGPFRGSTMAAAAGALLPISSSLIGATTGVVSSATSGALGIGATGVAGLAAGATGLLGFMVVARPGIAALRNAQRAQAAYNRAVAEYGARSRQAQRAAVVLDATVAHQPGLRRAAAELQAFREEWAVLSGPARSQFFGGVADVTRIGRRAAPGLTRDSMIATRAVRGAATSQARFLTSGPMQDNASFFVQSFARELPTAERTLENVERTFANIARAATPFFHDANVWVETWTGGWAHSTSDITATRREIGVMVDDARKWGSLTSAVYRTTRDIFTASRPSGDSLVVQLTDTFDRWDTWIQSHPERTQQWFEQAASSTSKMAGALSSVVHWLNQMSTLLQPILNDVSNLVRALSRLGLIGTPGALAAGYGAFKGLTGGMGGGRAGVGMPMMLGGFGGFGGRGVATSAPGVAVGGAMQMVAPGQQYLAPRAAVTAAGPGGAGMLAPLGISAMGLRSLYTRRSMGVIGSREWNALGGGVATPEAFAARYGGVAGARYAAPMSTVGEVGLLASLRGLGVGGRLAGAARGAARGFAPIALGIGALDIIGGQGNLGLRSRQAASDMTMGLLPAPYSSTQVNDAASAKTQQFVSGLSGSPQVQIAKINSQIQDLILRNQHRVSTAHRIIGGGDNSFFGIGLGGGATTDQQFAENKKRIDLLRQERTALRQTNAEMERQKRGQKDAEARQQGYAYGSQLGGAYSVYRRAGMGVAGAADATIGQAVGRLRNIRGAGVEALGEASLAWAREMARRNPALKGEVDKLNSAIEARFREMGKNVSIINGNILTGSKSEWAGIRDAMTTPAEQAREKVTTDFTAIQQQAIGSLTSMGFSPVQARQLVGAMEKGGAAGAAAQQITSMATQGIAGPVRNEGKVFKHARGGMIGGRGRLDTVAVPGGLAAPGEWYIANDHTMRDLSSATMAQYGLTAPQMIQGESRRHRYATGGFVAAAGTNFSAGQEPQIAADLAKLGQLLHTTVTGISGYRSPQHSVAVGGFANDPHTQGAAADIGVPGGFLSSAGADAALRRVGLYRPFYPASAKEINHVQLLAGGARGGALGGGGVLGAMRAVHLHGVGMKQPGTPGLLRSRAGDIYAHGLQQRLNAALGAGGGGGGGASFGASSWNAELGRFARSRHWSAADWRWIVQHESGGNPNARNPTSGAYGLGQFLGSTLSSYAKYGATSSNPVRQIDAMGQYISDRYGSPTQAKAFWQAHNWYGRGGGPLAYAGAFARGGSFTTNGPTAFIAGEGSNRRERVTVTRANENAARRGRGVVIEHLHFKAEFSGGDLGDRKQRRVLAEEMVELFVENLMDALDRDERAVAS